MEMELRSTLGENLVDCAWQNFGDGLRCLRTTNTCAIELRIGREAENLVKG
jgi:hypothetical protein